MVIKKLETRTPYLCFVGEDSYVRTVIDWNDGRERSIKWHLNGDQEEGKIYLKDNELEELFNENNLEND